MPRWSRANSMATATLFLKLLILTEEPGLHLTGKLERCRSEFLLNRDLASRQSPQLQNTGHACARQCRQHSVPGRHRTSRLSLSRAMYRAAFRAGESPSCECGAPGADGSYLSK